MLILLLLMLVFISNGVLAYLIARPVLLSDLPIFIVSWLVLMIISGSLRSIIAKLNMVINGFKHYTGYSIVIKHSWPGVPVVWGLLHSFSGIGLWMLLSPTSIWEGISFIVIWKLIAVVLLSFFTKTGLKPV